MVRGRPRRATSCPRVRVRVVRAVLGGAAGVLWLVLPVMTTATGGAVAITGQGPVASAAARDGGDQDDEGSAADLVLPLAVAGAAGLLAGRGRLRRIRRARTRTTPGRAHPDGDGSPPPPGT